MLRDRSPRDLNRVDWRRAVRRTFVVLCQVFSPAKPASSKTTRRRLSLYVRSAAWHLTETKYRTRPKGVLRLSVVEHRYPKELEGRTPLEEKLLAPNLAYGFITKFNVRRGTTYRRHVSGHITVFPNNIEAPTTSVLPHPLISVLDQVHIIWTGVKQPAPADVGKLLTVRPPVFRTALRWLQGHNSLYATVTVDEAELGSWSFEGSTVPRLAYRRMVRDQESVEKLVRTAQITPPADRGQAAPEQG